MYQKRRDAAASLFAFLFCFLAYHFEQLWEYIRIVQKFSAHHLRLHKKIKHPVELNPKD